MQKRLDVHQAVTDQIIAAIDAGAGSWQMPWHAAGDGLNRPVNVDTGNHYRGVNVVELWACAQTRGFFGLALASLHAVTIKRWLSVAA